MCGRYLVKWSEVKGSETSQGSQKARRTPASPPSQQRVFVATLTKNSSGRPSLHSPVCQPVAAGPGGDSAVALGARCRAMGVKIGSVPLLFFIFQLVKVFGLALQAHQIFKVSAIELVEFSGRRLNRIKTSFKITERVCAAFQVRIIRIEHQDVITHLTVT